MSERPQVSEPQPTDWPAAWAALSGMDGDAWDAESERLNALWRAEYVGAFVAEAVSRKWSRENAEAWAAQIADDALEFQVVRSADPSGAARNDVIECEREARNAG